MNERQQNVVCQDSWTGPAVVSEILNMPHELLSSATGLQLAVESSKRIKVQVSIREKFGGDKHRRQVVKLAEEECWQWDNIQVMFWEDFTELQSLTWTLSSVTCISAVYANSSNISKAPGSTSFKVTFICLLSDSSPVNIA